MRKDAGIPDADVVWASGSATTDPNERVTAVDALMLTAEGLETKPECAMQVLSTIVEAFSTMCSSTHVSRANGGNA